MLMVVNGNGNHQDYAQDNTDASNKDVDYRTFKTRTDHL